VGKWWKKNLQRVKAGGGGGGGYSRSIFTATAGDTYTYSVGQGGSNLW